MSKYRFLVEEHTGGQLPGNETITFHVIVVARSAPLAFNLAERAYEKYRGGEFTFSEGDLRECVPGYLWQAADGSTIWYEIRKLDTVPESTQSGPGVLALHRGSPEDYFVINPYWEDK